MATTEEFGCSLFVRFLIMMFRNRRYLLQLDVIDLAEYATPGEPIPYEQCEMCGNEKIRYAHVMIHPEYPEEIHVGCVCAEKMTDDYDTPRKRETAVRNNYEKE